MNFLTPWNYTTLFKQKILLTKWDLKMDFYTGQAPKWNTGINKYWKALSYNNYFFLNMNIINLVFPHKMCWMRSSHYRHQVCFLKTINTIFFTTKFSRMNSTLLHFVTLILRVGIPFKKQMFQHTVLKAYSRLYKWSHKAKKA